MRSMTSRRSKAHPWCAWALAIGTSGCSYSTGIVDKASSETKATDSSTSGIGQSNDASSTIATVEIGGTAVSGGGTTDTRTTSPVATDVSKDCAPWTEV